MPEHQHQFEFGGPVGCIGVMAGLPIGIWALYLLCNQHFMLANPITSPLELPDLTKYSFYSHEAMAVFTGWNLVLALLWVVVPGQWVNGTQLSDGSRLRYKMNGFSSFVIVTLILILATCVDKGAGLVWLHDHQLELATSSVIFSALLSVYLYVTACCKDTIKAGPGDLGIRHYDFFMGHELNPRIGEFDLKTFFELRPGLIGWAVLNAAMAAKEWDNFGSVSSAMVLVNCFQLTYVVDALWNEASILTTMDITTDGFGFMLAFGDLAWVPFTYGMQARYLAHTQVQLSSVHIFAILAVKLLGFTIFRGANAQKNSFRTNPNDPALAHLKAMPTERGTKLLISGWWGMSRHINYLGDWTMSISWSLPCGFGHVVPWFYVIYFAVLLVHRESRDEACCRMKYGKDWDKYCAIVPYHIIPYVY
eukprot:TRINITY_DN8632_c0_g1_i11.p1 TRINITY_DN8632_c0_g1~~TRINITY_DN8632_c0_g1_i11.p1  ORF type:complete len:421 (-),score=99.37 TRINITY_DN8632_c0_g1_i11:241-1503(-)